MRTIFSITILVLVLTAFSELTLAAPQTTLFFEPQNSSVAVNNSFSLKLKLNPGSNKVTAIDNNAGTASITVGAPPTAPVSSVSDAVTLNFKSKAAAGNASVSALPVLQKPRLWAKPEM
jgi:hypothetical protein